MSVGAIGSAAFAVLSPGQLPDPYARQTQVNAQADLLQAMLGMDLPTKMVLGKLNDGQGVDLYL
ncbi:hypothetical protein [Krasilnikovia sp. MM14-A1004]|uniref:hypothetical protein n=1 Tax=Krasilnikovia sp. MM14-A1004 TaxID=3373541 RepID=UPI00399D09C9